MNELLKTLYKEFPANANPFACIPATPPAGAAIYNRIFLIGGAPTESFDWRAWAPVRERQYWIPFCVSFSRENCAETLGNKQGINVNMSDRELGVISGTTIYGNTLDAVSEAFRLKGVRSESVVPFTDRMLTYAGDDIWKEIFDLPADKGEFRYKGGNHSYVYGRAAMIDALSHGPLQISLGLDGNWEAEGIVQPPKNIQGYHAIMLLFIDAIGRMYIQDSVGKEFKILSPDYPLTGCKSFRDLPENWKEIMVKKFIIKDGPKLGVMTLEGYTGNIQFADDMNNWEDVKKATKLPANAKTMEVPQDPESQQQ